MLTFFLRSRWIAVSIWSGSFVTGFLAQESTVTVGRARALPDCDRLLQAAIACFVRFQARFNSSERRL
jgi:hypothetical protein